MLKRMVKCLPVLLAALLLTGCGELSTPELAGRLASVIGTADAAEALEALGLPADEAADGASSYTLSSCPELVPELASADSSILYLSRFSGDTIASARLDFTCDGMAPDETYRMMKELCGQMDAVYQGSAYTEIYQDFGGINSEKPLPFEEQYPSQEDFLAAFEAKLDDTFPTLSTADCWWIDEEKSVYFAVSVRLTQDGASFMLLSENHQARMDYLSLISPMI